MKIRQKLTLAITLASLCFGAAHAKTFRVSHQWPQGDGRDQGVRNFIEEVQKEAPDMKFRVYTGSSLISNPTMQIDALAKGSIDLSVFPLIYGLNKAPEFSATIIPGAFKNYQDALRYKGTKYEELLQELAAEQGFHILTWWWTEGGIATNSTPITSPDSVKGMKFRGADRTIDFMLQEAGASVFSMPSTELYTAIQTKVIDGLMTSYETFTSMRLYEQMKHATMGGDYTIFVVMQPLVISTKAWNALSPEQQDLFKRAADATQDRFNAEQDKIKLSTIESFQKAGVDMHEMTEEEYTQWVELAKETAWPTYEKISPKAKALLDAIKEMN